MGKPTKYNCPNNTDSQILFCTIHGKSQKIFKLFFKIIIKKPGLTHTWIPIVPFALETRKTYGHTSAPFAKTKFPKDPE